MTRGHAAGSATALSALDAALRVGYLVLVIGPLAALAVTAIELEGAAGTVARSVSWPLLLRSVGLAALVTAMAMSLAVLVATALAERPRLSWLGWLCLALAPVAAYVHAQVWSNTALAVGRMTQGLGVSMPPFQGVPATVWVQTSAILPLAIGLAFIAVRAVPQQELDAARLSRDGWGVLVWVLMPMAAPLIVACASLVFLLSLLDFSVPTLYQVNVYALAVFADYAANNRAPVALAMSLPLMAVAATVALIGQRALRAATAVAPLGRHAATRLDLPRWFDAIRATAVAVAILIVLLPLTVLAARFGHPRAVIDGVSAAWGDVIFSFRTASLAALIAVPLAVAMGRRLSLPSPGLWWLAVALPLAVPAPLVGIGLIKMWLPIEHGFYGSGLMPALAAVARFAPVAALIALAQARRIDPEQRDATLVHQTSSAQGLVRVMLPMWAPGVAAAAALVFVLALGELGATLLVVPPGRGTLTLRVFNYLHYGASDTVAELAVLTAGVALVGGLVAVAALRAASGRSA